MTIGSVHPFDFIADFADALDLSMSEAAPVAVEASYTSFFTLGTGAGCVFSTLSTVTCVQTGVTPNPED